MTNRASSAGGPTMTAKIIERGRGPELEGTRVTVYRIMDYAGGAVPVPEIAEELGLTEEQVQVALEYIEAHCDEVEREYAKILERVHRPNPAWVEAGCAATWDELRRRIRSRRAGTLTHADPGGQ
jgi:uncharacterized protein (DUF433 family)